MRLIAGLALALVALALGALWAVGGFGVVAAWAAGAQREAQNAIAAAAQALRRGEPAALGWLIAVSAGYGFAHAVGPGHGKVLIGGAALATRATLARLVGLSFAASLAQSLAAVAVVYGGLTLFSASATQAMRLAEDAMAPVSGALIAAIGALLLWRGARALRAAGAHDHTQGHAHEHGPACGCGHAHGPTLAEAEAATGWREALAIVASVAIRPCTGAIFLLLIAWRFEMLLAGLAGVLAMGLGAGAFTALVAAWGRAARGAAMVAGSGAAARTFASLQLVGGAAIMLSGAALAASAFA